MHLTVCVTIYSNFHVKDKSTCSSVPSQESRDLNQLYPLSYSRPSVIKPWTTLNLEIIPQTHCGNSRQ